MPTTIANSQVENLRQYAEGNMVVRADGDHFEVSSNNSFDRLIVWTQGKPLPASQTRQVTEARERFVAAIGNRYGPEGGAAARDVLGANSRKPLRSRDIKQVFDALDRKRLGQPHPAPRESAISRASVPRPGDPPGPRENDLVAEGVQRQTPAAAPLDDLRPADIRENDLARAEAEQTADPDSLSETELASTLVAEQAADPDSLSETELASTLVAEQAADPDSLSETELASTLVAEQAADPDPLDNLPPPAWRESELVLMAGQKHGSTANPLDAPPAAAAPPIDTAAMEVQSEPQADPLLEPYQRVGIAPEYAPRFLAAGIPPEAAGKFLQSIITCEDDPKEVFQSGLPLELLLDVYSRPPLGLCQARVLHNAAQDLSILEVYAHYQLPIAADTMIRYTDSNVTRAPREFGRGGFNTVYEVEHDDGKRRIFKPLSPPDLTRKKWVESGWTAFRTGIDLYDPEIAVRNLSTCRLAEELGFDVVVQTELGLHTLPNATQPQLGLVMEVAPGNAARTIPSGVEVFKNPDVRREITKLQLLDCLTAQGDRHGGNYFIDVRPDGSVRVAGIDNDQCLGTKIHDPAVVRRGLRNQPDRGFRGCGLPPVIDTDMARALEDLIPDRVDYLIGDKVGRKEVHATLQRLSAIKDHIAHLRQEGRIIKPDDWAGAIVDAHTNFTNCYFQRDQAINSGIAMWGDAATALTALGF